MNPRCKARREQDEYVCVPCGMRWDVRDDPPGECGEDFRDGVEAMQAIVLQEFLNVPPRLRVRPTLYVVT